MSLEVKKFKLNKPDLKEGGKVVNKISQNSTNNINNNENVNKTNKNRRKPRKLLLKEILSNLSSTKIKFATSSDIVIEGEKKECLIDSGALTSFINYSYAIERKFNIEKVKNRKNWVSANGSQIEIAGQCELNIKIKSVKIKAVFISAKNLSHDVIIGTDILKHNKCVVDFNSNELHCRSEKIPINVITPVPSYTVWNKIEIEVEPNSSLKYNFEVDKLKAGTYVVQKSSRIPVQESIVENSKGSVNIIITNYDNTKLVINPRSKICTLEPCEVVTSINSAKELEKFLSNEVDIECVSAISNVISKSKPWKPSEKVKISNSNLTKEQKSELKNLIDKYWMVFSRTDEDLGLVDEKYGYHDITLKSDNLRPIRQRPYQVPYFKEKIVEECIKKMQKMNIILLSYW